MQLTIGDKTSIADIPPGAAVAHLVMQIEGRKQWLNSTRLRFETTTHNLRTFQSMFPDIPVEDNRAKGNGHNAFDFGQGVAVVDQQAKLAQQLKMPSGEPARTIELTEQPFKSQPFRFQHVNFERFKEAKVFGIFSEQGTGKTKTAIDIISYRWKKRLLSGVAILSWPKGVHGQWIEEQFPKHLWEGIPMLGGIWNGKRFDRKEDPWFGKDTPGVLQVVSGNIEMVNTEKGRAALEQFLRQHGQSCLFLIDESQTLMTHGMKRRNRRTGRETITGSKRTYYTNFELAPLAGQRGIMTGTPIAKNLVDEWSQFNFLDPDIIGHRYITSFRAQYCVMGGWENRQVIGHRNVEQFNRLVAPYIFRATKEDDLDLPPKVYDEVHFDLTDDQKHHQREMKRSFLTQLESGEISSVANAAAMMIRLQQLACGYLVDDDGNYHDFPANPRIDALQRLTEARQGKKIIWCRFNRDIENLKRLFGDKAVTYYGPTSMTDRKANKEAFISDPAVDYFVANPAAAGTGVDGLQICRTVIYYSNSFNSIERWQSEDRTHRIGMGGTVTYFDLVARGSVDRKLLTNLRNKKSFSDMTLDEVRRMANELAG